MIELGPFNFLLADNYIGALVFIVGALITSKLFNVILAEIVHHFAKKTKTQLDDELLHAVRRPIFLGILLLGLYLALSTLSVLQPYQEMIDRIAGAVSLLLIFYTITRVVKGLFHWYGTDIAVRTKTELDEKYLAIVRRVVNIVIYIIGILMLLRYFGVEITPLLASLGVGGIAVALALQDTFSNFFAGFYTLTERSIRVGDFIELESGLKGHVADISWRTTRIKTPTDNYVILPNSKLAQSITTNYYYESKKTYLTVPCQVAYDSNLERVEKLAIQTAKEIGEKVKGGLKGGVPTVRFTEFADSGIKFNIIMPIEDYQSQFLIKHEFIKKLKVEFEKNKIEIPYPTQSILVKRH